MNGLPVTYLFVPATEDRKIAKALQSNAGAVILDLEDSIPDGMKAAARSHLSEYLKVTSLAGDVPQVWVRVNPNEDDFVADVQAIDWNLVYGAVLPKADRSEFMKRLINGGAKRVIPIIETASGFRALDQLVMAGRVARFAIGTLDLALDLGIFDVVPDDSELIWQLRGQLVLASRQLGLPPPIDGIHAQFDDDEGLKRLSERVSRMGFSAKLIIHPRQIEIVSSVFRPDGQTLQHARDVIRAYDEALLGGRGAIKLNGKMIDKPVVERARALIARWEAAQS